MFFTRALPALLLMLASCSDSAPGRSWIDGGHGPGCERDADCDDGLPCTVNRCVGGECANEPGNDWADCDDGLFCTNDDVCRQGTCVGTPRDCSTHDDSCHVGACDEVALTCVGEPLPNDASCDDGLACTVRTTCQKGACVGEPFDCSALDGLCAAGRCDESAGACIAEPLGPFPGREGPRGDPTCENGLDDDCNGLVDQDDPVCDCPDCDDDDVCTFDGCDPITRECLWTPRAVDVASPVRSSGSASPTLCLVAGSNARAVVWAELRDTDGEPVSGATVTIGGEPAVEGTGEPGIYWLELFAEAAATSTVLSVDVDWCGDRWTLDGAITVDHVPGNATSGGTGGCSPPDGNVRVRVVEAETGAPIAGASVMVGLSEDQVLQHGPEASFGGASMPAPNVATTDASGMAELYDYGPSFSDRFTVTAGAPGRAYMTIADGSASDLVLPLPLISRRIPTTRYTDGTGSGSLTPCEEWDFALVIPQLPLEALSRYDQPSWLGKRRCYDSGNLVFGTMVIPENQWVPSQSIGPLCLLGGLNEARWSLSLPNTAATGALQNVSLNLASVSLDFATGGSTLFEILTLTDYRRIGFMRDEDVPTPPTNGRRIDANDNLPNHFTVTFSGQPAETDVVGIGAADYAGTNGTGALLFMGEAVHPWDSAGNSVAIPNSDLDAAGAPSGARRLAVVAALYLDKGAHPAIPANERRGVSTVVIRDNGTGGAPFGAGGGGGTASGFLDIAATSHVAPGGFSWEDATRSGNAPLFSMHELGVRTRRYHPVIPCESGNEVRDSLDTQWIVLRPFSPDCDGRECFTLPALPPSFPRAVAGVQQRSGFAQRVGSGAACSGSCPVAGESCADPDGSGSAQAMCMGGAGSEAEPYFVQDYLWRSHLYDLELAPSFDFDAFEFASRRATMTHESSNEQPFE